ncbi:MAG TPA: UDP-glucose/GDP-mannose dehydrogenase family protein [Candidatus Acidoferrales bacterium]
MRISVIGCGYVGLVTGACFSEIGHQVTCTDNDESKIVTLRAGKLPIYEPHLDVLVARNISEGRLHFTSNAGEAVRSSEAVFICVGTPPLDNGDADLSAIDNVARMIATEGGGPKLVVEKSTVPAQTGQELKRALDVYSRKSGTNFTVASNPEFLREGTAVNDFLHPDRIVVGVDEPAAAKKLREIYAPILDKKFNCPAHDGRCPDSPPPVFVVTTVNSAELIKHASNSFLALKISFANSLADMCDQLGADVQEVTAAVGMDPRIGPQFLQAGLGFGGFCLPKDVQAFIRLAERVGIDFTLLKAAEQVNKQRIDLLLAKARKALWVLKGKKIALLGLAFKPNTDDIRFSPAIDAARRFLAEGANLRAYDPQAMEKTRKLLPEISFAKNPYELVRDTDATIIATEWDEFKCLDWKRVHNEMARPLVIDARNVLNPAEMKSLGFEYYSFGR